MGLLGCNARKIRGKGECRCGRKTSMTDSEAGNDGSVTMEGLV